MATFRVFLVIVCLQFAFACKQPANHQSGYITFAGSRIYYEATGKGQPVLLLHGGFLNLHMWDQQIADLSKDFRVIVCDLRGHGATEDGSKEYLMADGLKALLDTLNIQNAAVVGLSMGGTTALEFAIAYPDYVNKMVLLGPGLNKFEVVPAEDSMMLKYDSLLMDAVKVKKDTALAAEYFIRCWFDGPHRSPAQTDTAQRAKAVAMAFANIKKHQLKYFPKFPDTPSLSRAGELKMPVLVIIGELDNAIIRIGADSIMHRVKDGKLTGIDGTAHMPNMEKPEKVNALIRSFLLPSAAMTLPPANPPEASPLTPAPKTGDKP